MKEKKKVLEWFEYDVDGHQILIDKILATLMEDQSRSDEHEDVENVEGFSDEEQNEKVPCTEEAFRCLETALK